MNYIYDILLNFNTSFYNFYDWNKKDKIEHIRKIPIFRVDEKTFEDFINYEIKLEENFMEKIQNKTEIFIGRKIKYKTYSFLITNLKKTIAIEVKKGRILMSDLLIDEEEISMESAAFLDEYKIPYKKIKQEKKYAIKTRKQIELEKEIKKELNKIYDEKNIDKLEYIYYECFDKKENNEKEMYKQINETLENNFYEIYEKLNLLLKITKNIV